jgi:hypothetical protein
VIYRFYIAVRNSWGDTNEFRICSCGYESEDEAKKDADNLNSRGRREYKVIRKAKEGEE